MLIPLLYYHRGATRGCCTPYNENIRGCCTPYQEGSRGCRTPYQGGVWGCCTTYQEGAWGCCSAALLHPLPYLITPGKGCSTPRQPPLSPGRGCTIPGTSSIEVAAPPGIPSVRGCRTPGTHFGTLRGVRLCKTTDVLEFSSTLMEQRTLDAEEYYSSKQFLDALASLRSILFSQ